MFWSLRMLFYEVYLRAKSIQALYVRIKQNCDEPTLYNIVGAPCAPAYAPRRITSMGRMAGPCTLQSTVHMQYRPVYKCSCILQYNSIHSPLLY